MGIFDDFERESNEFFRCVTRDYDNERLLYDSLVSEAINIHGVEMIYYALTYDVNYNKIWGEDNDRRYERCFAFMAYYELPKEDNNFTKLSIEPFDTVIMTISKKHFENASLYDSEGFRQPQLSAYKPKIGDIIKAGYSNYYYEIVDINQEENMFLQSKHTWTFTVKPFKNEHHSIQESELPFQQNDSFDNGDFRNLQNGWW
jgi:hypothetical protein